MVVGASAKDHRQSEFSLWHELSLFGILPTQPAAVLNDDLLRVTCGS
jgi:hypothetical protein